MRILFLKYYYSNLIEILIYSADVSIDL